MAEFVEVMKQYHRMHKENGCAVCKLSSMNNGKKLSCDEYMAEYPEEAQAIIMDWAKEHPATTNADKFKEVFGAEVYTSSGNGCCGIKCINKTNCGDCEYFNFWSKEYKEREE